MSMTRDVMPREKNETKSRTEFQIHINWKATEKYSNVVDLTEQRLIRLAKNAKRPELKSKILELLDAYKQNKIAIAWQEGEPAWAQINKG